MQTEFVMAVCDVYVKWKQGDPPRYRCYVNDELFTERTWIWKNHYLEEMLQIAAEPGQYQLRIEAVKPTGGKFKITNYQIDHGPAQWISNGILEIKNES
jgi:hypothetical protein